MKKYNSPSIERMNIIGEDILSASAGLSDGGIFDGNGGNSADWEDAK